LTDREWECLKLIAEENLTYKQMAERLGVKYSSVRGYMHTMLKALDVANKGIAVVLAQQSGWLTPDIDWQQEPVTPAQRLYLDAFDDFLRASGKDAILARGRMAHHLTSMFMEKGLPTPDVENRPSWRHGQHLTRVKDKVKLTTTEDELREELASGEVTKLKVREEGVYVTRKKP